MLSGSTGVGELQVWNVDTTADTGNISVKLTARIRSEVTFRALVGLQTSGVACGCDRGSVSIWQMDAPTSTIRKTHGIPRAHSGMAVTAMARQENTLATSGFDGKV